jgi:hypothetical protein
MEKLFSGILYTGLKEWSTFKFPKGKNYVKKKKKVERFHLRSEFKRQLQPQYFRFLALIFPLRIMKSGANGSHL